MNEPKLEMQQLLKEEFLREMEKTSTIKFPSPRVEAILKEIRELSPQDKIVLLQEMQMVPSSPSVLNVSERDKHGYATSRN